MDVFQSIGQGIEKTLDALKDSKERIHYQAKKYSRQSKLRLEKSRVEGEIKRLYEDLGLLSSLLSSQSNPLLGEGTFLKEVDYG